MIFHLFIGAIIAYVYSKFGIGMAALTSFVFAAIHTNYTQFNYVPNQERLLDKIANLKIENESEEIVGHYMDKPIHQFIMVKNPAKNSVDRYDYDGIIRYNKFGQIMRAPNADEVYTSYGLIYKKVA